MPKTTKKPDATPPYIRWYNEHHGHLTALRKKSPRVAALVSAVAGMTPAVRKQWARELVRQDASSAMRKFVDAIMAVAS